MTARILDRGHRRYEGRRAGAAHAVRSLLAHTLRRILGLRRPARSKVLPALTIAFAYVPAVVFLGVVALLGDSVGRFVPHYSEYYGFIVSAILLFVTLVAPEALCPDRRSRVLSLYLASPLTRGTYLLAKVGAVFLVLCAVTVGPPLLLLVGLVAQDAGPDGPLEVAGVVIRIAASGIAVAAVYTSVSVAVASLTDRRAVASAATLLVLLGSNVASVALVQAFDRGDSFALVSLTRLPFELVRRVFGRAAFGGLDVATWEVYAAAAFVVAAGAGICWFRYRSLRVTR